jgi:iron complex transport system substrate-binding protein
MQISTPRNSTIRNSARRTAARRTETPRTATRRLTLRPSRVVPSLVAVAVLIAACGGSDESNDESADVAASTPVIGATGDESASTAPDGTSPAPTEPEPASATSEPGTTAPAASADLDPDAPDLGRVVALAEEFLLADVMTLGIEPIASTATVDTAGFQGMDEFDTDGIEVLPQTTLNLEHLASLEPDTIITLQFWVDQVGADVLSGIADVVVVPDGLAGTERMSVMGELLGRPEHAAAAVDDYDVELAEAQARVGEGCAVSLATIYPGPTVAAFVDGPWEIPSSILATGCALDPGADDIAPDANGRAWLSLEQLGVLDAATLILLQNETVAGEADSVAEIEANSIWQQLPAVQADQTVTFDRLGYPGLFGQIRFLDEFSALMD